jgi:2-succinyl-5-enolpyruvyl-6-hydroxy-3-cyclohexene-1-carboxylate synthase
MKTYFSAQRNVQIVISLLKQNGIKRVVTSPGMTDVAINISLQHDPYFELYSCVDERSAAYMACGMAAETDEPVVLTCTGATASRNYMPAMTEAYYRHLPVLAITCSQPNGRIGHYVNQVTDRTLLPRDVANVSITAKLINSSEDEWEVTDKVNRAMIGLRRNGGGPCHINLEIGGQGAGDYSVKEIKPARKIEQYDFHENLWPEMSSGRIAIFVGQHCPWRQELTKAVDNFCESYNAFVMIDNTSNYRGKYGVLVPIIFDQAEHQFNMSAPDIDLVIHIGYVSHVTGVRAKRIWRVNEDGEMRDTFKRLTAVFAVDELTFFQHYSKGATQEMTLYHEYKNRRDELMNKIPDLPFSNLWIASKIAAQLPEHSSLHLGIRNSLRAYDYFDVPQSISVFSNTGGFGIDGGVSSLIGASMMHRDRLYLGVFGDLLFFYDMNSLGNRDISPNVRVMVVNNGLGQEFKNYSCGSARFGDEANPYIAAQGHYGCQSRTLIKAYAEALGFEYITASNKEEFLDTYKKFLQPEITQRPILFEVFTQTEDENKALELATMISNKSKLMNKTKEVLQSDSMRGVKNLLKGFRK